MKRVHKTPSGKPRLTTSAMIASIAADGQKTNGVTEAVRNAQRPRLKLRSSPLKTMIFVAELTGGKGFEPYIVLDVRGRDDDGCRAGELEQDALEGR